MKKIISFTTILFTILAMTPKMSYATEENGKNYFRVTAYYSPLPNQNYYIKGNLWAEKRMNGEGIRGASGKTVFSGMLAAPSKYSFGTKIELKGLGIGEVADRGGAIVQAGERNFKHDRIDVWMGYGDEGLRRAMYWGNRVIEGNVIDSNSEITLNYNTVPAPIWAIPKTKQNSNYIDTAEKESVKIVVKSEFEKKLENELKIFNKKVETEEEIKTLQERLTKMGLYSGKIDGNYNNIIESITIFQLNKKLITKKGDLGTGYFGPKTRSNLMQDYKKILELEKLENEKIQKFEEELNSYKIVAEKEANKKLELIGDVKFGHVSPNVRELQITLKDLGYFNLKDTAIFGNETLKAIKNYQLDKKVIVNSYIPSAGYFGPETKKQLKNDLANKFLQEKISKNPELTKYYKSKKEKIASQISETKKI